MKRVSRVSPCSLLPSHFAPEDSHRRLHKRVHIKLLRHQPVALGSEGLPLIPLVHACHRLLADRPQLLRCPAPGELALGERVPVEGKGDVAEDGGEGDGLVEGKRVGGGGKELVIAEAVEDVGVKKGEEEEGGPGSLKGRV